MSLSKKSSNFFGTCSIAVGVNAGGRREVPGMDIGPSEVGCCRLRHRMRKSETSDLREAGTFWAEFLRKLRRRGLLGVKLVVIDAAHEGTKAAVSKLMNASWQRCRVHFMRNALARLTNQALAGERGDHPAPVTPRQGTRPAGFAILDGEPDCRMIFAGPFDSGVLRAPE